MSRRTLDDWQGRDPSECFENEISINENINRRTLDDWQGRDPSDCPEVFNDKPTNTESDKEFFVSMLIFLTFFVGIIFFLLLKI